MSAETFLLSPACIFRISLWFLWQRAFTSSENSFLCSFLITAVDPGNMRGLNFAFMVFSKQWLLQVCCIRLMLNFTRCTSHTSLSPPQHCEHPHLSLHILCQCFVLQIVSQYPFPLRILTVVDQLAVSQCSSRDLDKSSPRLHIEVPRAHNLFCMLMPTMSLWPDCFSTAMTWLAFCPAWYAPLMVAEL